MSGPKVTRVRTRAERVNEARVWIARVDAASRRWERRVRVGDLARPEEIALTRGRAAAVAEPLGQDRFEEVEHLARQELAFLDRDLGQRTERAARIRARLRHRGRRLASSAASLLASLDGTERDLPAGLKASLEAGQDGRAPDLDALEAAIGEAIAALAGAPNDKARRERQATLAARLADGEATHTLADWLARRPAEDDPVASQVDTRIARLEVEGSAVAAQFAERARTIAAEPSARRRRLLADSLMLDLATALTREHDLTRLRAELDDLAAELALAGGEPDAVALRTEIRAAPLADPASQEALRDRAAIWLARHRADAASQARREAVLSSLSAIGYEVREGMQTAWVQDRRLVLRRGGADLGIELAGDPGAARLQVRAIGFEVGPGGWDHARDRDVEQGFCADLGRLQDRLSGQGCELTIERALPVGAQPLRTAAAGERDSRDGQARLGQFGVEADTSAHPTTGDGRSRPGPSV